MSSKILSHPDKDDIIKMLSEGASVNRVQEWLRERYPKRKERHITYVTLQNFRKKHLNLEKEAISQLRRDRDGYGLDQTGSSFADHVPGETKEEKALRVQNALMQTTAYQEKLNEIKQAHMDTPRKLMEIMNLVSSRAEAYYNKVASAGADVATVMKEDRMLLEYLKVYADSVKDFDKVNEQYQKAETSEAVNFNVALEQIGIIRDIIQEEFATIDPELALRLMEKLTNRLSQTKYVPQEEAGVLEQYDELNEKIVQLNQAIDDKVTNE